MPPTVAAVQNTQAQNTDTTPSKAKTGGRISLSDSELKELAKEFREHNLPKRHTCPKCQKNRERDQFGVRLMNGPALREGTAVLPVFRIQSYCTPCRSVKAKK